MVRPVRGCSPPFPPNQSEGGWGYKKRSPFRATVTTRKKTLIEVGTLVSVLRLSSTKKKKRGQSVRAVRKNGKWTYSREGNNCAHGVTLILRRSRGRGQAKRRNQRVWAQKEKCARYCHFFPTEIAGRATWGAKISMFGGFAQGCGGETKAARFVNSRKMPRGQ